MDESSKSSLLLWIQSFQEKLPTDNEITQYSDLCDGVFLSRIMHLIDPEYLNLDQIHMQAGASWVLKTNNLNTLCRGIQRFYSEELGQLCDTRTLVEISLIANESDALETAKLSELLLGCAVQCPRNRQEHIHMIMQMNPVDQASIMHMIEGLMHRFPLLSPTHAGLNPPVSSHLSAMETQESSGSSLEMKLLDLEKENRQLTQRIDDMQVEQSRMNAMVQQVTEERDKLILERQSTLTRDNKKIQSLVESELHALSAQLEEKDEVLQRTKQEANERIMLMENEVRRQADELDISRSKLAHLNKLEATVAKYKKRLDDLNTLRAQVKELETHNAQYLDKILDLESTIKTMPALKALVEKYKNQVVDLETANVEAMAMMSIKDQRLSKLQEELDASNSGKEFLEQQAEELRIQITNLQHHVHEEENGETSENVNTLSAAHLLASDSVSRSKERVAALEREVKELKNGREDAELMQLSNELDIALKSKDSMQLALLQLQRTNIQLTEELAKYQNRIPNENPGQVDVTMASAYSHDTASSQESVSHSSQSTQLPLQEQPQGISQQSLPAKPALALVADYEERIAASRQESEAVSSMRATVTELTARLKEKESLINNLSEQKSKLENYTKKTLHAVQTKYMVAVSSHRNQIMEKQERVDFLEKKMKELRNSYSREQALMMASFYEIGTEMQRRTMMPQNHPTSASASASSTASSSNSASTSSYQPSAWLTSKRTEERSKRRIV